MRNVVKAAILVALLAAFLVSVPACGRKGTAAAWGRVKVSDESVTIEKQQSKTVTVSLTDLADGFNDTITLKTEDGKGVESKLSKDKIGKGEESTLTITTKADAAAGDTTVTVTGTPTKGDASKVNVKVTVK